MKRIGLFFVVLLLGLLLLSSCSGGGGEGSFDPGETQQALEATGFTPIFVRGSEVTNPLIIVGGLSDPVGISKGFSDVFSCRGEPFDAVFLLDTRVDVSNMEPADVSVQKMIAGMQELGSDGVTRMTVLGQNTGGMIARAALVAQRSGIQNIDFISLFSPFDGLTDGQMRPGYPSDFRTGSAFIEDPGPLPPNVRHLKINATYSRADTLLSANSPDAVFMNAQIASIVDTDSRIGSNLNVDISNWPFTTPARIQEALDALGFSANACNEGPQRVKSLAEAEVAVAPGVARTYGNLARDLNENDIQLNVAEFAALGLEVRAPNGIVNRAQPFVIIVHGQDPQEGQYNVLESELVQQGYAVFRFVYFKNGAVNPDIGELGEQLRNSQTNLADLADALSRVIKLLSQRTGVTTMNVIGHSLGGVIARTSMTGGDAETLASSGININLVTVASPFAGTDSLVGVSGALARFGLKAFENLGGAFYAPLLDQNFLGGMLGNNIFHRNILTDESAFGSDYIITIAGQTPLFITSDPQYITADELGGGIFSDQPLQAGHSGVLQLSGFVQYIIANLEALRTARGEDVSADPTPTPTSTPRPSSNDDDDDDDEEEVVETPTPTPTPTAGPSPTPTATPTPTPTPTPNPGAFSCPDTNYSPTDAGCGLDAFSITETGNGLLVQDFGENGPTTFTITGSTTASTSGLSIFDVGGHTCVITCTSAQVGTMSVFCTTTLGTQCMQQFAAP